MVLASPIQIEQTPAGKIRLAHNGRRHEVASVESALRLVETMLTPARAMATSNVRARARKRSGGTVKSLAGKYRDVLTPTEVRAAEKQHEIRLEERKWTERGS